jgi:hypothetical protein
LTAHPGRGARREDKVPAFVCQHQLIAQPDFDAFLLVGNFWR